MEREKYRKEEDRLLEMQRNGQIAKTAAWAALALPVALAIAAGLSKL